MSDLIERQDALDAIDNALDVDGFRNGLLTRHGAKSAIESVPPAQPTGQWIPVSERLPDKAGKYLVTLREGYTMTYIIAESEDVYFESYVIAWMPMPAPFREGK